MLGGALEARRGRGEHTAKGARRLSGKGWRSKFRLRGLGAVPAAGCAGVEEWTDLDRWHWMMLWFVAYDGFEC